MNKMSVDGLRRPDPNCDCNGRGWFTMDMMGEAFLACHKCNTHEVISSVFGSTVYEAIALKKGCVNNETDTTS